MRQTPRPAPKPQYDVRSPVHRLGFDWPWRIPQGPEELMILLACVGECMARGIPLQPGLSAWIALAGPAQAGAWREGFARWRGRIRPQAAHLIAHALGLPHE